MGYSDHSAAAFSEPPLSPSWERPMQIGLMRLTPFESQGCLKQGLCIYCSLEGINCPVLPKGQAHQLAGGYWYAKPTFPQPPQIMSRFKVRYIGYNIHYPLRYSLTLGQMITSLMPILFSKQIFQTIELPQAKEVLAGDGRLLSRITHRTVSLLLMLSRNHHQNIELLVASPFSPAVLGLPWLKEHKP